MFAVVEGIDGSGTTTVADLTTEYLANSGRESVVVHEVPAKDTPEFRQNPIGTALRSCLLGETKLDRRGMLGLFLANRWWVIDHVIRPALASDKIVVMDRYAYSTWVYQQDLFKPNELRVVMQGMLVPDRVYLLDVSVNVAQQRKSATKEMYDDASDQKTYRMRYQHLVLYGESSFRLGEEDVKILNAEENNAENIAAFLTDDLTNG